MAVLKLGKQVLDIIGTVKTVVSQLDLEKSLAIVLRKAMELTKTDAGSIALYNSARGTMRIHAHKGFSKDFVANREWKVRRGGLTERILKARTITVIPNTSNQTFFSNPLAVDEGIKSLISVPLIHQQQVVGILYVDDFAPRKFSAAELRALEILASFASIAISHARVHTSVKQQAITDGLTGLFNRRCFEDLLSRELQRARRHGRELSLALVDVNDFKKYNDAFGHQAGDEALAALGAAVRAAVRSTDLAARYGGDEIVIILPETKLAKAYGLFVDRIKREIEEGFARISERKAPLSVSIGIASYPQDGRSARDLVLAADKALMTAKKDKHNNTIGCSRRVRTAVVTPSPLRTVPGAGSGLL
jgi:diguanylate cyclase (GGDEF)-like protein